MKPGFLLGIVALVPAALNVAPAAQALTVPVCTGAGLTGTVTLPVDGDRQPADGPAGCCAKACHASSRKKSHKLPN